MVNLTHFHQNRIVATHLPMFSKLLTPEKEREYIQKNSLFSNHAHVHTPKRLREPATGSNANDMSSRVRMMDLDALRITEADIQLVIEQRQKKTSGCN